MKTEKTCQTCKHFRLIPELETFGILWWRKQKFVDQEICIRFGEKLQTYFARGHAAVSPCGFPCFINGPCGLNAEKWEPRKATV